MEVFVNQIVGYFQDDNRHIGLYLSKNPSCTRSYEIRRSDHSLHDVIGTFLANLDN